MGAAEPSGVCRGERTGGKWVTRSARKYRRRYLVRAERGFPDKVGIMGRRPELSSEVKPGRLVVKAAAASGVRPAFMDRKPLPLSLSGGFAARQRRGCGLRRRKALVYFTSAFVVGCVTRARGKWRSLSESVRLSYTHLKPNRCSWIAAELGVHAASRCENPVCSLPKCCPSWRGH